jgi:hypothetical protein
MKKKKQQYRIRNWREYNAALVERGSLTFWFDEEVIQSGHPQGRTGRRGRLVTYTDVAIQCMLILKGMFHLPLQGATLAGCNPCRVQPLQGAALAGHRGIVQIGRGKAGAGALGARLHHRVPAPTEA